MSAKQQQHTKGDCWLREEARDASSKCGVHVQKLWFLANFKQPITLVKQCLFCWNLPLLLFHPINQSSLWCLISAQKHLRLSQLGSCPSYTSKHLHPALSSAAIRLISAAAAWTFGPQEQMLNRKLQHEHILPVSWILKWFLIRNEPAHNV